MFCFTLFYVHSGIAIILMGKRKLVALLNLSFWCLVMVERLFLAVPWGCLRFMIVVFPDHTHLLFWNCKRIPLNCVSIHEDILGQSFFCLHTVNSEIFARGFSFVKRKHLQNCEITLSFTNIGK